MIATIDVVLFAVRDGKLSVALHKRPNEPYAGMYALPGGFIFDGVDKNLVDTTQRVMKTKLGIDAPYLEQLCTVGSEDRDNRGWSISIIYYALVHADDLTGFTGEWFAVDALPDLPFDHTSLVELAVERLRNKAAYSTTPIYLMPDAFTLSELQGLYEQIMGFRIDKVSFRRKMVPYLVDTGLMTSGNAFRPAKLYKIAENANFMPFSASFQAAVDA